MLPLKKRYWPSIVNAVALTASYQSVTISLDEPNFVGININYTKGSETNLQVKIEAQSGTDTNFYQETSESVSAGTVTVSSVVRQYGASGLYSTVKSPIKADKIKISFLGNSVSTGPGTVSISLLSGWC